MGSTSRFSDETNAYIDAAPLPPPDLAEEDDFMQDLIEYNLPQLHQHLEAPVPKSVPTPPKFSMASSNSPRKRTSRARPKLRANTLEQLRNHWMAQPALLRSGRTKTRNFFESSNPMREARYSWKVIAGKLDKPEPDVKIMWNYLKTRLG